MAENGREVASGEITYVDDDGNKVTEHEFLGPKTHPVGSTNHGLTLAPEHYRNAARDLAEEKGRPVKITFAAKTTNIFPLDYHLKEKKPKFGAPKVPTEDNETQPYVPLVVEVGNKVIVYYDSELEQFGLQKLDDDGIIYLHRGDSKDTLEFDLAIEDLVEEEIKFIVLEAVDVDVGIKWNVIKFGNQETQEQIDNISTTGLDKRSHDFVQTMNLYASRGVVDPQAVVDNINSLPQTTTRPPDLKTGVNNGHHAGPQSPQR